MRKTARRLGYRVVKSHNRTPQTFVFGTFGIIDPYFNLWAATAGGSGYGLDLDAIEQRLEEAGQRAS